MAIALNDLAEQLADLRLDRFQRCSPFRGGTVVTAHRLAVAFFTGLEVATFFQSVQQGVQRARTYAVTVVAQLVQHGLAVDFPFHGVMQHVERNQAGEEEVVCHNRISISYSKYVKSACSRKAQPLSGGPTCPRNTPTSSCVLRPRRGAGFPRWSRPRSPGWSP